MSALIVTAASVFTIGLLTLVIPVLVFILVTIWYYRVWRGRLSQP